MDTYVIFRNDGWVDRDQLDGAIARSAAVGELMAHTIGEIRSYVLNDRDGSFGTLCVIEAESPEAVRRHATAAGLPVDEIVKVADTIVVRSDSAATAA